MSNGPKLLLIDGTNLCFREFFAKKNLSHKGRCVDVLFGVFRSLIALQKKYPDHLRIIAWEGGYARRLAESTAGVENGLIPETYKENRRRKAAEQKENPDPDVDMDSLFEQMDELKDNALPLTRTLQVRVKGYEADDILNTYADYCTRYDGEAVIVSSDQDFYMCINDNVSVLDMRAKELYNLERFRMEFGYEPEMWLDKGAIEGEVGPTKDNIFGVDGWGKVTANKYVTEYGGIEQIKAAIEAKKKRGKREQTYLEQWDRLVLARSLKSMDLVPDVPRPRILWSTDEATLRKYFINFGFASILRDACRLV
jgi:DNA polymerase-1